MTISIREANAADATRWDEFVEMASGATFFHRFGWRTVLESAFSHQTHYLIAEQNGKVAGVLPLAEIRSFLFGHHLISTPFCVYGGVVAIANDVAETLTRHACTLAVTLGVEDLELRNLVASNNSWPGKALYVTFRKSISAEESENLKAIPRKQRAMVRKGIQAGLRSELSYDTNRFYRVYAESVRNLGTPVVACRYFQVLQEVFADDIEIALIENSGTDIAAVMSFYFRDEVLPYYGGSLPRARDVKGNDFMYWDLMCRAARRGVETFDYGRSKVGTGAYSFKKNWGFKPIPLHYEHFLVRAKEVPQVNPTNPKYERLIAVWKRLPLFAANAVGPLIAKHLG